MSYANAITILSASNSYFPNATQSMVLHFLIPYMHHTWVGARGASPRTLTFPLMKVRPHMYVRVSVRVPRSFPWGDIAWPLLTSRRTCYECQLDFSYFFACNTKFTCLRSWWVDDFDKSVPRTWPVQGSQHFQGVKRRLGNKMSQFGFTCLKLLPSK